VRSETRLRALSGALAAAGIAVAAYIAISEAGGGAPACVAGSSGCATVAESPYSELGGVGVALVGVIGYAVLLAAALVPGDAGRFAGLVLALAGFGFTVYLTYLEIFVIEAICQWCVVSAVLITALLAVNAARAIRFAGAELGAQGGAG
jgi:uncharacterized membrane protein